jgi:cytochrome oxidase Cu insertion factor (SCO1/SenC/PrrC family)
MMLAPRIAWSVFAVVAVVMLAGALWSRSRSSEPPRPLPVSGQVQDFAFTDQRGQPITAQGLRGRVWIAGFVFTRCYGQCPLIMAAMSQVHQALADAPEIQLVSFSMDPEYDTPAVLAQYAETNRAVSARWFFATGKKDDMYRLTRDSFKLGVTEEGGTQAEPIIHSESLVLVDREGRISGYYSGLQTERVQALIRAARELSR